MCLQKKMKKLSKNKMCCGFKGIKFINYLRQIYSSTKHYARV